VACASHRGPSLRGADSRVSLGVDEGGFVEVDGRWLIGSKKPFVPRIPKADISTSAGEISPLRALNNQAHDGVGLSCWRSAPEF